MLLISILILILPQEIITQTICSKDENVSVSDYHFMLKNQNQFELFQEFHPFTLLQHLDYNISDYNLILITKALQIDRFVFVFQNSNIIHIRLCFLQFWIIQDTIKEYSFTTEYEISVEPLGKVLNVYYYLHYLYLIYEEEQYSNDYLIQVIDRSSKMVHSTLKIKKMNDCSFHFEEYNSNYFYFAQLNCQNWVFKLYKLQNLEISKIFQYEDYNQTLRQICSVSLNQLIQLTFDHIVYVYYPNQDYVQAIYRFKDREILFYNHLFQILSDKQNDKQNDEQIHLKVEAFIRQERPKQIFYLQNNLIFLFGSQIELIYQIDLTFNLMIELNDIIVFQSTSPYIFGVKNNQLILIRVNQMNPLFKCLENKSFQAKFYKDYQHIQNWVFKTKKKQIVNEFVQYFNNSENIFQDTIPIILKEFIKDSLEFEINLNKFTLGGSFDILNVKSFQNNIKVSYEIQKTLECNFLNFEKIIFWFNIEKQYDLDTIFLVQDESLALYLIGCNQSIQKILNVWKLSKKNIYQVNKILLIQTDKQTVNIIEFKKNLQYKIDKIVFKKEINYIQGVNSYFRVYLNDWEEYLVHKDKQIYQIKESPIISSKIFGIILKKKMSDQFVISTESQIILMNHYYTHTLQVLGCFNMIQINQNQFLVFHKTQNQDKIQVIISKYYLCDFQFIKMYDFPIFQFEYMWPIYMNENNDYLAIAAKETLTNNIINLQIIKQQIKFNIHLYY